MDLGAWQGLESFHGAGTFLVPLGAGMGRVRWLAWTPSHRFVGEASDKHQAQREADDALAMLQAIAEAEKN